MQSEPYGIDRCGSRFDIPTKYQALTIIDPLYPKVLGAKKVISAK